MKKRTNKFDDGRKMLNNECYYTAEKNEQYLKYIVLFLLGDYLARVLLKILKLF